MKKNFYQLGGGILLLGVVIFNICLWFIISTATHSFDDAKSAYLSKYPGPLSNAYTLTLFNMIVLSVAAFLFYRVKETRQLRLISTLLFILAVILFAWQVFSIM